MEEFSEVIGRIVARLAARLEQGITDRPELALGFIGNDLTGEKGPDAGECAGTELARPNKDVHGEVIGIRDGLSPSRGCQPELNDLRDRIANIPNSLDRGRPQVQFGPDIHHDDPHFRPSNAERLFDLVVRDHRSPLLGERFRKPLLDRGQLVDSNLGAAHGDAALGHPEHLVASEAGVVQPLTQKRHSTMDGASLALLSAGPKDFGQSAQAQELDLGRQKSLQDDDLLLGHFDGSDWTDQHAGVWVEDHGSGRLWEETVEIGSGARAACDPNAADFVQPVVDDRPDDVMPSGWGNKAAPNHRDDHFLGDSTAVYGLEEIEHPLLQDFHGPRAAHQ